MKLFAAGNVLVSAFKKTFMNDALITELRNQVKKWDTDLASVKAELQKLDRDTDAVRRRADQIDHELKDFHRKLGAI